MKTDWRTIAIVTGIGAAFWAFAIAAWIHTSVATELGHKAAQALVFG